MLLSTKVSFKMATRVSSFIVDIFFQVEMPEPESRCSWSNRSRDTSSCFVCWRHCRIRRLRKFWLHQTRIKVLGPNTVKPYWIMYAFTIYEKRECWDGCINNVCPKRTYFAKGYFKQGPWGKRWWILAFLTSFHGLVGQDFTQPIIISSDCLVDGVRRGWFIVWSQSQKGRRNFRKVLLLRNHQLIADNYAIRSPFLNCVSEM